MNKIILGSRDHVVDENPGSTVFTPDGLFLAKLLILIGDECYAIDKEQH